MDDTTKRASFRAARAGWTWGPVAVVLACAVAVECGIRVEVANALESARDRFRVDAHDRAAYARDRMTDALRAMYEGLRTIARLPGVRELGAQDDDVAFHGGEGLEDDSRRTIQEIYNNLSNNVDLSEVYVAPLDLDPDATRGVHTAPLTTFDELLLGQHAGAQDAKGEDEAVEEVELYEYRTMRTQLAWFREHVPAETHLHALEYPALCGPEVVTCDNRHFDPRHPDEHQRAGLVYSVPFFRPDGALAGCVSGVVRTRVLQELLDSDRAVVVHAAGDYVVTPNRPGPWRDHAASWRAARPAAGLVYSETLPMPVHDASGPWLLWSCAPDAEFWASPAAAAVAETARAKRIVLWTFALVVAAAWIATRRRQAQLVAANAELEQRVRERTAELLDATRVAGMAELAARILHNVGNVLNGANVSVRLLADQARVSKAEQLARVAELVREHEHELARYLSEDPRGKIVPRYLASLATELDRDEKRAAAEIEVVARSLAHAIEILEEQRSLASTPCLRVELPVTELADATITLMQGAAAKRGCTIERDFTCSDAVSVDRSRATQIVVNLLTNAMDACAEAGRGRIVVRTRRDADGIVLEVEDDGAGIAPENATRIFSGKFTTKAHGHGIGLHASAVAAGEFGAKLTASSAGPGRGATFHLALRPAARELARAA